MKERIIGVEDESLNLKQFSTKKEACDNSQEWCAIQSKYSYTAFRKYDECFDLMKSTDFKAKAIRIHENEELEIIN